MLLRSAVGMVRPHFEMTVKGVWRCSNIGRDSYETLLMELKGSIVKEGVKEACSNAQLKRCQSHI